MIATVTADSIVVPALCTAHSHAFQRGLRGKAQRRSNVQDDFWTWRGQMYELAASYTPETLYTVSKSAFASLFRLGVRTVGEFHYLHHQSDGTPYADRTILSQVVIQAALDAGLRISLLRAVYGRSRFGVATEDGQRRFCDSEVEHAFKDVEDLLTKYAGESRVRIGLAPHSIRAIPAEWWNPIHQFVALHPSMPVHMHVAEQTREVDESIAEYGRRPIEYLDSIGMLSPRFVAVHAVDVAEAEVLKLGKSGSFVCVCPTTERDLGDGIAPLGSMRDAGVALCVGIDSHVVNDPIEEIRSLETHERLRTKKRVTFHQERAPSEVLWHSGAEVGERACGFETSAGAVSYDRHHPSLADVADSDLLDALVFSGCSEAARS